MDIGKLKVVYFLGIGGIGMSALARYLNKAGKMVHGYDKTPTLLTAELEAEGMTIHYEDRTDLIPEETDLVIYTPAIPANFGEFRYIVEKGFTLVKRSELLGAITNTKTTMAVAGTHGKTTVTTMLSHILYSAKEGCTSFLGGIAKNYNSNLLLNPESRFMVAEADEFDRSFLRLFPWLAVITSADADHLDIYGDHQQLLDSFADFTSNIHEGGFLLVKKGVEIPDQTKSGVTRFSYSIADQADFMAENLRLTDGIYNFDLKTPVKTIMDLKPGLPGLFNVENSIAAASAAWLAGCSAEEIRFGINTFEGVKRRFDLRINRPGFLYIDDYAHHPEELKACIGSVRALYPERHITGIFQPHLYTRTRDFAEGFASSLSMLDRVILLDIYPARELPIEGVSSAMLLKNITTPDKQLCTKSEALELLSRETPDILLTLGAGDIDQLVAEIEVLFSKKETK
ncbi:MAG: UDP-N-acetylmuramate--L-alanine ligase [Lentimicrobium sp.]|nr:UDP-N-acetylmuramate--L-alanine ligase [Lentimicrobium sp.]